MRRAFVALGLALAVVLGLVQGHASPGAHRWEDWSKRPWTPRDLGGVLVESWADAGVTLGTTPRSEGTAPPVATWSGSLTPAQELCLSLDSTAGGTDRGQATFRWSEDGCSTYRASAITTAATNDLGTTHGTVTVAWPVGTYNTDQKWRATVAEVLDRNGSNKATQATAATQPLYRATAFGGRPALDWGASGTYSLATPAISLGAHSILVAIRGDAGSGYVAVHNDDNGTDGAYIFSSINQSFFVGRAAVRTGRNVSGSWARDGVRRTAGYTYDGTHAGHLVYLDGVDAAAASGAFTDDPGTASVSGALYLGSSHTPATIFRGLICGWTVVDHALTPLEIRRWHDYAIGRCPL